MPDDTEALALIVLGGLLASGQFAKEVYASAGDLPSNVRGIVKELHGKKEDGLPAGVAAWFERLGVEHAEGKKLIHEVLEETLRRGKRKRAQDAATRIRTLSSVNEGSEWLAAVENILKPIREDWQECQEKQK